MRFEPIFNRISRKSEKITEICNILRKSKRRCSKRCKHTTARIVSQFRGADDRAEAPSGGLWRNPGLPALAGCTGWLPKFYGSAQILWEWPNFMGVAKFYGSGQILWEWPNFMGVPKFYGSAQIIWECPNFMGVTRRGATKTTYFPDRTRRADTKTT